MIAFARPWSLKGWNTYALAATSCSLLSPWGVPEGTPVGLFHAASFLGVAKDTKYISCRTSKLSLSVSSAQAAERPRSPRTSVSERPRTG